MDETGVIPQSKVKIEADTAIPKGSWFGPVHKIDFLNNLNILHGEYDKVIKIVSKHGMLHAKTRHQNPWYVYLHPARDIHEQNMTVFKSRDHLLYIRATKDISPGEAITCWYDETLALDMGVPYLTPANIIGVARYCCVTCHREFTYPNYLKLHMMYQCSGLRNEKNILNHIDKKNFSSSSSRDMYSKDEFYGRTYRHDKTNDKSRGLYLSDLKQEPLHGHNACIGRYTLKASFELIPNESTYAVLRDRKPYQIKDKHDDVEIRREDEKSLNILNQDTDEEEPMAILRRSCSFMSSSKGHLCVFCGKLYSRKYGLKIHLRTHTGYKPLKCKICLRAFGDPSNLNKHIRLHAQGSTPYQCSYCSKILVRRRDLVRHLKSRHPNEVSQ